MILDSATGKPITGKVYTDSVFMDWYTVESQDIWNIGLEGFRKILNFDGIALDFNENTVFTNNTDMSKEEKCNSKA